MSSGAVSDREEVLAVVAHWEQAQAAMAALSFSALTAPEVLAVQKRLEKGYRSQWAVDHKLIHQLTSQSPDQARRQFLAQGALGSAAHQQAGSQAPHQASRIVGAADRVDR
jgi:hypothetical protein